MSLRIKVNWNTVIQALLAAATTIASAITLNSCYNLI